MQKQAESAINIPPSKLGAKPCPNCREKSDLHVEIKTIASRTIFAEIGCYHCLRQASSDVQGAPMPAIRQAVERWNSKWPDIAYYLDSDTEGVK